MKEKYFITTPYIGSDGKDFAKEFSEYLQELIATRHWRAMSDHQLFLSGGKTAIEEIISILTSQSDDL